METATQTRPQPTPEQIALAEKIIGEIPPYKPEEKPVKAQPAYEKRGPVKFKNPLEASKTGYVFEGDIDFSKLSDRQLKAFRKLVREQARIYAREYENGEREKDKAEFKKVQALMQSVIAKANVSKRKSFFVAIGFGFLVVIELAVILAVTMAPKHL